MFPGLVVLMLGSDSTDARSPERTPLRVHCVGTALPEREMRGLCQQLVQSLALVLPRAAPRQVSGSQWPPRGDSDISVRLEMSAASGRLLWQTGPTGALHAGPDRPFPAGPSPDASGLRQFTDDLVSATQPLLTATRIPVSR